MKRFLFILIALTTLLPIIAQEGEQSEVTTQRNARKSSDSKIITGFSGGMLLHAGYAFSQSPDALFRNGSLADISNVADLPKDGVTLGLGGALRLHLLNHIHVGAEGGVSTMPLMKSGSNIRSGWGGALCDVYWTWGKVSPLLGLMVGGGTHKRLYVPSDKENVAGKEGEKFNSSYTKTPFFLLDPYVGLEVQLSGHVALLVKMDYMLPFGKDKQGLAFRDGLKWDNFMSPSGPRLYVGVMFGKR